MGRPVPERAAREVLNEYRQPPREEMMTSSTILATSDRDYGEIAGIFLSLAVVAISHGIGERILTPYLGWELDC